MVAVQYILVIVIVLVLVGTIYAVYGIKKTPPVNPTGSTGSGYVEVGPTGPRGPTGPTGPKGDSSAFNAWEKNTFGPKFTVDGTNPVAYVKGTTAIVANANNAAYVSSNGITMNSTTTPFMPKDYTAYDMKFYGSNTPTGMYLMQSISSTDGKNVWVGGVPLKKVK